MSGNKVKVYFNLPTIYSHQNRFKKLFLLFPCHCLNCNELYFNGGKILLLIEATRSKSELIRVTRLGEFSPNE
jgi:hypothetical protein